VIVQTDALPTAHASDVVCQMTFDCSDAPDFRVTFDPSASNGLRVKWQNARSWPIGLWRFGANESDYLGLLIGSVVRIPEIDIGGRSGDRREDQCGELAGGKSGGCPGRSEPE